MKKGLPAIGLAALVLLAACEGSGGGGGPGPPTGPSPAIVVVPDRGAAAGSVSLRAGAGSAGSLLVLEVVITELVDLHSVDFLLAFPSDLLAFRGARQGPLLGTDAALVVERPRVDQLSLSLVRAAPAGVTGSGVVLAIELEATASGEGRLEFVTPEALDPFGLEFAGVDWIDAAVRVAL